MQAKTCTSFIFFMKKIIFLVFIFIIQKVTAQELFVFTEPASNMAAKSIGIRMNNYLMQDIDEKKTNYHLIPEIMWGISRRVMVHMEGFLSNRNQSFVAEGGGIYGKYRFYSVDDVHNHFRMAAFGRYSFNNSDIHQNAIDLNGHNSGYEVGIVATQLITKVAISSSVSFLHAKDNGKEKFIYANKSRNAVNYTLSAGKLMLPKEYTSYKQTNLNLMVEILGQTNLNTGVSYLDVAPSVQFVFFSKMRFDAGYRFPVITNLKRTSPEGVLLRFEFNLFNVY